LAIVGANPRGRLPSPLEYQRLKFPPPLGVPPDDGDCGIERVNVGEVGRGHSKVAHGSQ
jgi:hypothetical protein